MNRETIEKAVTDYAASVNPSFVTGEFDRYAIADAFENGAHWRINSVWHDMREKPEREDEYLLVEYRDWGGDRSDYEVIASEDFERCCRRKSTIFIRWAYINDLLPDVTKETDQEKCCGNCRHFSNEDINGNGWCSEIDDETTCGQTCENWREKQSFKPE